MGEPHQIDGGVRPRLGELLVQRGLLTQEQLEEALEEQQASGQPLGAILVRDGLVASHTMAILLAEQSGGPLKTEFGFAVAAAPRDAPAAAVLSLRPPTTPLAGESPLDQPIFDGLRLTPAETLPEPAPVVEPVQELLVVVPEETQAPQRGEAQLEVLEAQLGAEAAARLALEAKLREVEAGTEAALAAQSAIERRLAELDARAVEALAGRAPLEAQLVDFEARAAAAEMGRSAVEHELATLRQRVDEAEAVESAAQAREAALQERLAGLERRLADLDTRPQDALAERATLEAQLVQFEAQAAAAEIGRSALEQELATLRQRMDEAEAAESASQRRHAALQERLSAVERDAAELAALRASEGKSTAGRPYLATRHLLLAPVGDRYELVERSGPPPEAGSRIELFANRSFLVVRVGSAPLPGALEACAYLEPIPTRLPPPNPDTEPT